MSAATATRTKRKTKARTSKRKTGRRPVSSTRLITPEDLLRFVFVGSPRISGDGSRILFTHKRVGEKNEYESNIWSVETGSRSGSSSSRSRRGSEPVQFTSGGRDTSPRFAPDDSSIAFIRAFKDEGKSQIFTMRATGGEATALTDFHEGSISTFRWSPDGEHIALAFRPTHAEWTKQAEKDRKEAGGSPPPRITESLWYRLDGDGYFLDSRYAVYLVEVATGETRRIFDKDDLGNYSFDFSPDSRTLAVSANPTKNSLINPHNDDIYLVDLKSGKAKKVPNLPKGPKAAVRWSPDGRHLAYAGRENTVDSEYSTENLELFVCDPHKGNARSLTAGEDYCLMATVLGDSADAAFAANFRWHPDSKRVFMQLGWHGESHIASIAISGKEKIRFLTKGAVDHTLGNFSKDGKSLALLRGEATKLNEVALADINAKSARVRTLTDINGPLLKELELAKPESHWIKSEDGNDVHVWIMKPPRAKRKKTPAILEIHGGPHAQYGASLFHEFQCLAAAGYAVFYSNPRGSKGYGRDHCHAIRGSWGDKDWVDLQAVIDFMASRDFVDTKRMGVMGGSYGGYMTNWIIGHTDRFAGAITDRCVSNLVSMWGSSDFPGVEGKYWPGNPWDKPEGLWKSSPIRLMNNVSTPTLIIHSEGDLRCNVEQAEQVFAALCSRNVPTRFVRYPQSTSHGFSRAGAPDLRLHRLHEILNWWRKWLG